MGLLKPCYVDEQTHYRYYDIKQNARLDMIQYMKELGMEGKYCDFQYVYGVR